MRTWLTALPAWPAPGPAEVRDRLAERLERRARGRDVRVLAADERRQLALARALRAARDGRVDGAGAALGELARDAARRRPARSSSSRARRRRSRCPPRCRPAPSTTASTSGESDTQRHTSSAPSRGLARRRRPLAAPRAASASSRSRVRLCTVSSCPASSRCPAMYSPIVPSPIHAIFMRRQARWCGRRRLGSWSWPRALRSGGRSSAGWTS